MTSRFRVAGHFETCAPNNPKMTLNTTRSKIHTIYVLLKSQSPKFHPIFLYDQLFSRYNVNNHKCTKWPQNDLEVKSQKVAKSALYTLNTLYLRGPNFVRFTLWPTVFKIQGCWKSEMHRMTSKSLWTLNRQTYLAYTKYPRGPNLSPFHSTAGGFPDPRLSKSEMYWTTSNWLWNSQKYLIYTKYCPPPPSPKFGSVLLYD